MQGWIRDHRQSLDTPELQSFVREGVWSKLLKMAAYKDCIVAFRNKPVHLKRGQALVVLTKFAEQGGITRKQLRTVLGSFSDAGMIEMGQAKGQAFTFVTIKNYDKYQSVTPESENLHQEQGPSSGPSKGQARAKQGPTEQEKEEVNNINIYPPPYSPPPLVADQPPTLDAPAECVQAAEPVPVPVKAKAPTERQLADEFEQQFWPICPRKKSKGAALKAWVKARKGGAPPGQIIDGMAAAAAQWARDGTEARFIPHPSTWLNRQGWLDEIDPVPRTASQSDPNSLENIYKRMSEHERRRDDQSSATDALGASDRPKAIESGPRIDDSGVSQGAEIVSLASHRQGLFGVGEVEQPEELQVAGFW